MSERHRREVHGVDPSQYYEYRYGETSDFKSRGAYPTSDGTGAGNPIAQPMDWDGTAHTPEIRP